MAIPYDEINEIREMMLGAGVVGENLSPSATTEVGGKNLTIDEINEMDKKNRATELYELLKENAPIVGGTEGYGEMLNAALGPSQPSLKDSMLEFDEVDHSSPFTAKTVESNPEPVEKGNGQAL